MKTIFVENISKKKSGRPKKHARDEQILLQVYGDTLPDQTRRTLNNQIYYQTAFGLLIKSDEFSYLVDNKKHKILRKTIMVALGRIAEMFSNGDELALELAQVICRERLNTAKAIDLINKYRISNGEALNKNKIQGTLKKIINVIRNSCLDVWEVNLLMAELEVITIKDLM